MKAATGGHRWETLAGISAEGSAVVAGLHGTAGFDDDLRNGRYARRFNIAVQGSSADVYDGTTMWAQDISGGVHAYDAWFPRRRAVTDAYLARRGYFNSNDAAAVRCSNAADGRADVAVIRVIPHGGIPAALTIDRVTHLLLAVSEREPITTSVTHFSDYRTIDGLVLPFSIASGTVFEPNDGYVLHVHSYSLLHRFVPGHFTRPSTVHRAVMISHASSTTVPITLESQQLIVWVSINHHVAMPFILDTGGHAILTTGAARALGLRGSGNGESGGSGSGTAALQYTRVQTVRIGNAELHDQPFLIIDYPYSFYERGGRAPLAGIIGLEWFERFAARIDYARREITFSPLDTFQYRGSGTPVHFRFQEDMPMVQAAADGYPGLFGTDTGNSGSVILFGNYLERNHFFIRYNHGYAVRGSGTGGTNSAVRETLRRFTIGGHTVYNIPSAFTQMKAGSFSSWTEAGNIGYAVLSRFIPTYDYAHETLYLDPNPHAQSLAKNRSGLGFSKDEPNAITVTSVQPGSAAAISGITAGDRITELNGRPVTRISYSDFFALVTGPAGTPLRLRLQHGNTERTIDLVLR